MARTDVDEGRKEFSMPLCSAQPRIAPLRTVLSAIHTNPGARHGIADLPAVPAIWSRTWIRPGAAGELLPYRERRRVCRADDDLMEPGMQ